MNEDTTTPVRWGVVGCGWVARDYGAPGLRAAGPITAICDANPAAVAAFTDAIACDNAAWSVEPSAAALAARDDVDAVYVATPNHTHAAVVRETAAAGKPVLCEKPIASNTTDAADLINACSDAGVLYATAYDQRWHPAHVALRRFVADGRLGTVTQARIHYACWLPADWSPDGRPHDNWRVDAGRAGGGAAIDLAPHGVDLLAVTLGRDWDELHALTQRAVQRYAVDDGAVLVGRLGHTLASLHVAYNCPDAVPRRRLELIGTAGSVIAENTMGQTPGGSLQFHASDGSTEPIPFDAEATPFAEQAKWFARRIHNDDTAEHFNPTADLRRHKMLLQALHAADTPREALPPGRG